MSSRNVVMAAAGASVSGDPYFENNTLLLYGDGANGAQNNTFIAKNYAATSALGGYSVYFDGSGDYLSFTGTNSAFQFGTGDWTIETWVNISTVASQNWLDFRATSGNGAYPTISITAALKFSYVANSATQITGTTTIVAGTWYHVAVTRSGTSTKLFVNGVQEGSTYSDSTNYTVAAGRPYIGGDAFANSSSFNGYISNTRIVKGTALYTSNFTPSTTPLTAVSGTSLLTCQSPTIIDNSTNNFTITVNGNATVASANNSGLLVTRGGNVTQGSFSPYGNLWSNYFDGTGDYLSVASNNTIPEGNEAYTIECWFWLTGAAQTIVSWGEETNNKATALRTNDTGNGIRHYWWNNDLDTGNIGLQLNTWNHVAAQFNGTTRSIYVNGVLRASDTPTGHNVTVTNNLKIGARINAAELANGYISNLRIITGTALYTSNFIPSTSPLTAISGTSLLTCQSNRFIDNSSNNFAITRNGDAKVTPFAPFAPTSAYSPTNGASAYFDGTGDYLRVPYNSQLIPQTGKDFTAECWIYITGTTAAYQFIVGMNNTSVSDWSITNENGTLSGGCAGGGGNLGPAVANQWIHLAIVKSGSKVYGFYNGVKAFDVATGTQTYNNLPLDIGARNGADRFFPGYISGLRINSDTALYTPLPSFTPSTTPLTAITNTSFLAAQDVLTKDYSTNNYTLTAVNGPTLGTSGPFGSDTKGYGIVFGAPSTRQSVYAAGGSLAITTGPFTVEGWINPSSYTSGLIVHNQGWAYGDNIGWGVSLNSSGYLLLGASNGTWNTFPIVLTATNTVPLSTWSHFTFVRDSNNVITCLINGVPSGSVSYSASLNLSSSGWGANTYYSAIGANYADGVWQPNNFAGQISNIRISKTAAFYPTSAPPITLPSTPLSAIANTSLLLNFDNAGIYDATAKNNLETIGNVQINTTTKKYGAGSMYFDGTGDYLYSPATENLVFGTGDFTIETWMYVSSFAADMILFDMRPASTQGAYPIMYTTASTLRYYVSTADRITSSTLTTGKWYHIAISRSNSVTRMFIDGIAIGSWADTTNYLCSRLYIGTSAYTVGAANFNGYMDDFRITKGVARYTNNFTPADWGTDTALLSDQYYKYVSLLLRGNGTNAAQNNTFVDSSSNNSTITRAGNTTQGTFSPFSSEEGKWSNYFDGSGDYLSATYNSAFDLASTSVDFTVESFVYIQSYATIKTIASVWPQGTGDQWIVSIGSSGTLDFYWASFSASNVFLTGGIVPLNTWSHVAVTKSSSVFRLFVNGTQVATTTNSSTSSTSASLTVGYYGAGTGASATSYWNGYISNLRIVKGTALYTSNFTVPTSPLTVVSGTSLLTCQSNRFKDNSSNNFAITVAGDTKVLPYSPFAPSAAYDPLVNGGSGYFDGTGDNLTFPSGSAFQFGTGDFTVEFWTNFSNADSTSFYFIDARNSGQTANWAFYRPNNNVIEWYNGSAAVTNAAFTAKNTWTHIAYTRSGTTGRIFLNGVQVATGTDSTNYSVSPTISYIGSRYSSAEYINGYISNLRVVKGTALYTSAFTPPTAPLTAITNTSLLCNFTNAGIIDTSRNSNAETIGNAQISTSVKKYGTGSLAFDGSGDWLILPVTPHTALKDADFTIEFWLYPNSLQDANPFTWGTNDTYYGTRIILNVAGTWSLLMSTTGTSHTVNSGSFGSYAANNWVHVALVRNGTNIVFYVNGVSAYSTTLSGALIDGLYNYIGALKHATTPFALNGYIDDLRITKGVARYTANFTPPSAALPNQ